MAARFLRASAVCGEAVVDGVVAGGVAAVLSGAPSTVHALLTGEDVVEATLAAGTLLLPRETRRVPLVVAAVPAHVALSLGWGVVLSLALPRRRTVAAAVVAGLGIAALDLGLVGRRYPRIRALPTWPQVADHVAYGAVVGAVLERRRAHGSARARRLPWSWLGARTRASPSSTCPPVGRTGPLLPSGPVA